MDTSNEGALTDTLGRRTGPRRQYTIAEKRRVAEESRRPGSSVALASQRHKINANLIFGWRRLLQQGVLTDAPAKRPALLPVRVTTPTLVPTRKAKTSVVREPAERSGIEIEFPGGRRIWIRGRVDRITLKRVLEALASR